MIDTDRHLVIQSAHPSPYSAHAGFFGSRPFSRTNEFLQRIGEEPIDWEFPPIWCIVVLGNPGRIFSR